MLFFIEDSALEQFNYLNSISRFMLTLFFGASLSCWSWFLVFSCLCCCDSLECESVSFSELQLLILVLWIRVEIFGVFCSRRWLMVAG